MAAFFEFVLTKKSKNQFKRLAAFSVFVQSEKPKNQFSL
jgi:hypothetical protein